jgi:ABC-type nitrate/sulfonate/bicarbonate transport system substrate-binding protein
MHAKRTIAAVLSLAVGFSLAACQDNASSVAVSSAASASSAAVSTVPKTQFTVALSADTPAPLLSGIYAADAQGYFTKCGLEVVLQSADTEKAAVDMVTCGTAQFAAASQSGSFAEALAAKKPVTAVASLLQHSDAGVLVPPKGKKVNRFKQLDSIPCLTGDNPVLTAKLKTAIGADGGNVPAVTTASSTGKDAVAVLKSASVPAFCGSYSWDGLSCRENSVDANFLFFRDADAVLDEYPLLLATGNSVLKQKPKAVKDMLTALQMGYSYAASHPENTTKLLCSKIASVRDKQALIQRSLTWLAGKYTDDAARWGVLDSQRWNHFYTWMNQQKLTTSAVPLSTGMSNDYLPD